MERTKSINPAALEFVGLAPDVVKQFKEENREELLGKLSEGNMVGNNIYVDATHNPNKHRLVWWELPVPGTEINLRGSSPLSKHNIPHDIIRTWHEIVSQDDIIEFPDNEIKEATNKFVTDVLESFGERGFIDQDWQSAINAFDASTEGNIFQSEKLKALVAGLPLDRKNHTARYEIAIAIHNLIEEKLAAEIAAEQQKQEAEQREFGLIAERVNSDGLYPDAESRRQACEVAQKMATLESVEEIIAVKRFGSIQPVDVNMILIVPDETPLETIKNILDEFGKTSKGMFALDRPKVEIFTRYHYGKYSALINPTQRITLWRRIE